MKTEENLATLIMKAVCECTIHKGEGNFPVRPQVLRDGPQLLPVAHDKLPPPGPVQLGGVHRVLGGNSTDFFRPQKWPEIRPKSEIFYKYMHELVLLEIIPVRNFKNGPKNSLKSGPKSVPSLLIRLPARRPRPSRSPTWRMRWPRPGQGTPCRRFSDAKKSLL